jgi:hypothetical protein
VEGGGHDFWPYAIAISDCNGCILGHMTNLSYCYADLEPFFLASV